MKVIYGLKELDFLVHKKICVCLDTSGAMPHNETCTSWYFFQVMNQIVYRKWDFCLRYLQNMQIYYPSGKYKPPIHSFLEYFYTIPDRLCAWYCASGLKGCLVHDTNVHKIFQLWIWQYFYQVFHLCKTQYLAIHFQWNISPLTF